MELREVQLQELWRDTRPGEPIPGEVVRLKSWEGVIDAHCVGHCTGDSVTGEIVGLSVGERAPDGSDILELRSD